MLFKTLHENNNLLIACNFSLSHIVCYPISELPTFSFTNFVVSIILQQFTINSFPESRINYTMRYGQQVQTRMDARTNGNLAMTLGVPRKLLPPVRLYIATFIKTLISTSSYILYRTNKHYLE